MDESTRKRLLELALQHRDWMAVMDVYEDMGGDVRAAWRGNEAAVDTTAEEIAVPPSTLGRGNQVAPSTPLRSSREKRKC